MTSIGMSYNGLGTAIDEAKRFINAAKLAQKRFSSELRDRAWTGPPTKEAGSARRASMDLTRALADLRRYS